MSQNACKCHILLRVCHKSLCDISRNVLPESCVWSGEREMSLAEIVFSFLHLLITAFMTTTVTSCFMSNSSLSHFSFRCSTLCAIHLLKIGMKLWRVERLKDELSSFLSCFHLSAEIYIVFMNKENLCKIHNLSKVRVTSYMILFGGFLLQGAWTLSIYLKALWDCNEII